MPSQTGLVSTSPVSTTTATTTPWPLPALPGALRLHALPRFGLKALYRNQRRSTVKNGTCLKIMVSPVRVRVPPLPAFSGFFLFKPQVHNFSVTEFGSYSSLFWSFPGSVAVRVAVNTFVTGQLALHQNLTCMLTFGATSISAPKVLAKSDGGLTKRSACTKSRFRTRRKETEFP